LILTSARVEARDRSILQEAKREARLGQRVTVPELTGTTISEARMPWRKLAWWWVTSGFSGGSPGS